jgi:hypothetical protein
LEGVGVAAGVSVGVALPLGEGFFHVSARGAAEIATVGRAFPSSRWDSVPEAAQPAQQMAKTVNSIVAARVFHPMATDTRRETWECSSMKRNVY